MKLRIAFLAVATIWAGSVMQSSLRAQAAPAGARTVWDGVYTDAQAERGKAVYTSACTECHGADLTGDGFAPALTGPEFVGNWTDLSIGDLFERIRISMPPSGAASVTPEQKADIVAYVMQFNKYPAGQTELESKTDALKTIKIVAKK
ncbi:MAG: c-type cytochrome [Vicinamibacterales bacterium]